MTLQIITPDTKTIIAAAEATLAYPTGEKYREMAKGQHRNAWESFDRCDTDGFVSQWASTQLAHRYMDLATHAENRWIGEVWAAYDLEGNLLTMEMNKGDFNDYYFIKGAEGKARFFTPSAAQKEETRIRNNAKKGYIEAHAVVILNVNNKTLDTYPAAFLKPADDLAHALEVIKNMMEA